MVRQIVESAPPLNGADLDEIRRLLPGIGRRTARRAVA